MNTLLTLAALLAILVPVSAQAQNEWPEAADALTSEAQTIRSEAQAAQADMAKSEQQLRTEVSGLRQETSRKEALLNQRKERFEALLDREAAAQLALAEVEQDVSLIESAALNTARDAERLFLASPAALAAPGRMAACRAMLDAEGMPTFEQIQDLIRGLFQEISGSGHVAVVNVPFLGPTGDQVSGQVLLVGNNAAFHNLDGSPGGLTVIEGGRFSAGDAPLPRPVDEAVSALFRAPDAQAALPLDLSGGSALLAGGGSGGFWGHIRSGGVLVWPILAIGLAGLLLGLERLWVLTRVKVSSSAMLDRLAERMRRGDREGCRQVCSQTGDSPACRVLGASLDHAGAPKEVLENVFHDAILKEVPRLERFLPTLAVFGAVAPLLGLLGTVTGMINTFSVMTLSGNSDPKLMSGGISEALVTTELGLAVAIPILLLHHFLERRVDAIVGDMEEKSVAFSVTLLGTGHRRTAAESET